MRKIQISANCADRPRFVIAHELRRKAAAHDDRQQLFDERQMCFYNACHCRELEIFLAVVSSLQSATADERRWQGPLSTTTCGTCLWQAVVRSSKIVWR